MAKYDDKMEKLEKENAYLKEIIANIPEHVYWKDINGNYLGCNQKQAEALGLRSREEIINYEAYSNQPKEKVDHFRKIDKEIMGKDRGLLVEEHFLGEHGKNIVYLTHKSPLHDKNGNVIGLIGVSTNITDQWKYILELSKNIIGIQNYSHKTINERIKGVIDYLLNIIYIMPGNVYWKDKEGKYLGCNENILKIHGFHHMDQIIGKTYEDLFTQEEANKFRKIDQHVMKSKQSLQLEETLDIDNNNVYLTNKVPLTDENGHVSGILGISINITARKKAKEALENAKEQAELADKVKTEFLHNMRHDIRTSLSGIQGFSELIKNEAQNKKIKEYANNLVASCRALTHIHNQILHAVYVFSGEIPIHKNKFDLRGKLKQIVNLNLAKASEKGLKLTASCDPELPKYLIGDCKRLTGIVQELVANALKYTEEGSVNINVQLEKKTDNKVTIKFSVQDTGIGIAEDKKQEIFSRFSRLNPAYEGRYSGLGLGLSIVKQFVDDLGGEIYVTSKLNKGSTFTCYLQFMEPLSQSDIGIYQEPLTEKELFLFAPSLVTKCKTSKKTQENVFSKENTVLLVEDDEICANVASRTLEHLGYAVDIAWNGKEALEKALHNDYIMIFMDIGLPDISGNEVTRKIRIAEKLTDTHIPIIALTAHIDRADKQQCIESGMDAVLSKPIVQDKIEHMLDAFIPKSKKLKDEKTKKSKTSTDKDLLNIEGEIIDFDYIKNKLHYSDKALKEIIKIAKNSLNTMINNFKRAYKQKNWKTVRALAHKISGSTIYCGAMRLNKISHNLEDYLRANKKELLNSMCDLVIKESKALQKAIDKFTK